MVNPYRYHRAGSHPEHTSCRQDCGEDSNRGSHYGGDSYRHFPGNRSARTGGASVEIHANSRHPLGEFALVCDVANLGRTTRLAIIVFRFEGGAAAMANQVHTLKLNYHRIRRNRGGAFGLIRLAFMGQLDGDD